MPTTTDRVGELLAQYDRPDASAADLLCDRHPADAVAFTVIETDAAGDLVSLDLTYGHLREQSTRFAAALAGLGVEPGDRVATLMGKSADLVVARWGSGGAARSTSRCSRRSRPGHRVPLAGQRRRSSSSPTPISCPSWRPERTCLPMRRGGSSRRAAVC